MTTNNSTKTDGQNNLIPSWIFRPAALYSYSNYSDKVGTIKDGDTVLDYMDQVRNPSRTPP